MARTESSANDGEPNAHTGPNVGNTEPRANSTEPSVAAGDSCAFAEVAWQRSGFLGAYGSHAQGTTQRNLFGQIDGSADPVSGSAEFECVVWGEGKDAGDLPEWLRGGTSLVLRDIALDLDTWDEADRPAREFSIGRRLGDGAPLTGTTEDDEPDFAAVDERGLTVISAAAHIARARKGGATSAADFPPTVQLAVGIGCGRSDVRKLPGES